MLTLHPSSARGHANHGWLDSFHTFSFADYFDPQQMGFSVLRVINEDRVSPSNGFGTHPHKDMEIVTVVLSGALQHKDSLGHTEVLRPGEVQRMSAGTGVRHSEVNPSDSEPVHLLQIWIETAKAGIKPDYEQKSFPAAARQGRLQLVLSPDGHDGTMRINQDASLYLGTLNAGDRVTHVIQPGRKTYVHVATGQLKLDGQPLGAGDGVRVQDEQQLVFETESAAEVLVFDLP